MTRRGTVALSSHICLRVAGQVVEDGGKQDEAIGALLHDAAEDHGGYERVSDIRRRYGDEVADILDASSDSYDDPPSIMARVVIRVRGLAPILPARRVRESPGAPVC